MKILHVVGARPNFVKAAAVVRALRGRAAQVLVHTGQHHDPAMSTVFFEELALPLPDVDLQVGSAASSVQTGRILLRLGPVLARERPDVCVVYGDVTSTLAAALAAVQHGTPVAHVEAGLRSHDRTMPEERNRILTDHVADWLFTPSQDANDNLAREGAASGRVHLVGNVMIDSLSRLLPRTDTAAVLRRLAAPADARYVLVTLHRPSTVDEGAVLPQVLGVLAEVSRRWPVVFPVHPRTRARLDAVGGPAAGLRLTEPLGYLDFLSLEKGAAVVVTDSGGVQEETTWLGVPCLTLRDATERPVTVTGGTNTLVGRDAGRLREAIESVLAGGGPPAGGRPDLWDGRAAERIARVLTPDGRRGHAGR